MQTNFSAGSGVYLNFDAAPLSIFMDPGSSDVIAADAIVGGVRFDNCSVLDDRPV